MEENSTAPPCPFTYTFTWHPIYSSESARITSIIAIVISGIAMPFTIFFNGFLIFVVLRKPSLLSKERVMAVVYLLVTDFFTGLVSYPLFIATEVGHLGTTPPNCYTDDAFYLSLLIFSGASIFHLVVVVYERHIAINQPYFYHSRITLTRLAFASKVVWICVVTCNGVFFTVVYTYQYSTMVYNILDSAISIIISLLLAIMVYWYVQIFYTLCKIRRRINKILQTNDRLEVENENFQRRQNQRSVFTSLILSLAFLIPYTLVIVEYVLIVVKESKARSSTFYITLSVGDTLVLLNSLFNPIIFCLRTIELKGECKNAFLSLLADGNDVQQNGADIEMQEVRIQNPCKVAQPQQ